MHERINEIIEFLMNAISTGSETVGLNLEHLSEKLLEEGYTEKEIHKAVEWVILNLNPEDIPVQQSQDQTSTPALRTLIAEEVSFFTKEAYGYLIQMQVLGILSPLKIEQVIEKAFLIGISRIDLEEIKGVVTQVLMGPDNNLSGPAFLLSTGNDFVN